jgi:hypothetical protein
MTAHERTIAAGVTVGCCALFFGVVIAAMAWIVQAVLQVLASARLSFDFFGFEALIYLWHQTVERVLHPGFVLDVIRLVVLRFAGSAAG